MPSYSRGDVILVPYRFQRFEFDKSASSYCRKQDFSFK